MNMLTDAVASCGVKEVSIGTVYLDGNRSSHFNPLVDSMCIYFVLTRFFLASLISAAIDFIVFTMVYSATGNLLASVAAGRVSSLVNFFLNRRFVFSRKGHLAASISQGGWAKC